MAKSICPKCGNHKFEAIDYEPVNLLRRIQLIQCASCGVVISALDPWCHSDTLSDIAKKLGINVKR